MYQFLLENRDSKNYITDDPSWFVFEVKIKLKQFLMRFKTISSFYRLLSQSEYSLGKVSNRTFFKKKFTHGWYRSNIDKESIRFVFILKVKDLKRKEQDIFQLIWRTKRLINSPVLIYPLNELTNTDKILFMNNNRVGAFKKILGNRS